MFVSTFFICTILTAVFKTFSNKKKSGYNTQVITILFTLPLNDLEGSWLLLLTKMILPHDQFFFSALTDF
jgi:hypothetical protein